MMAIQQLDTLSGVAKGLTRLADGILISSEEVDEQSEQLDAINCMREDLGVIKLHHSIFAALQGVIDLWSSDAEVAAVSSTVDSFLWDILSCAPGSHRLLATFSNL